MKHLFAAVLLLLACESTDKPLSQFERAAVCREWCSTRGIHPKMMEHCIWHCVHETRWDGGVR